jgi:hypothetical protein
VGMRSWVLGLGAALLALVAATPVLASEDNNVRVTFFHGPGAEARWAQFTPPPAGDHDTWSIKLTVPNDPTGYAGAQLHGVEGPPPANPPSFDYLSTVAGASGGSPRLHMSFSDGGSIELRPLILAAGAWVHEDGAAPDWDNNGGACGFRYEVPYAVAVACHPAATVTSVYVVTDSAWLFKTGYTHWIDNIRYAGHVVTRPGVDGDNQGGDSGEGGGDQGD